MIDRNPKMYFLLFCYKIIELQAFFLCSFPISQMKCLLIELGGHLQEMASDDMALVQAYAAEQSEASSLLRNY